VWRSLGGAHPTYVVSCRDWSVPRLLPLRPYDQPVQRRVGIHAHCGCVSAKGTTVWLQRRAAGTESCVGGGCHVISKGLPVLSGGATAVLPTAVPCVRAGPLPRLARCQTYRATRTAACRRHLRGLPGGLTVFQLICSGSFVWSVRGLSSGPFGQGCGLFRRGCTQVAAVGEAISGGLPTSGTFPSDRIPARRNEEVLGF
jgi:hypothetical protein